MKLAQCVQPVVKLVSPEPDGQAREAIPTHKTDPLRIGICCSGGGIRSASYCLGALQVLREEKVLGGADYVSAVSGGSYIASAFASAAARSDDTDPVPVFAPGSVEEAHLRNHSSYMAPDPAGKARLLLRIVGGALWHLFLVAVLVVIVFWPASWAYAHFSDQLAGRADGLLLNSLGLWLLIASVPLILGLFLILELWEADSRRPWADWMAWIMVRVAGLLALVLVVIPQGVLAARAAGSVPLGDWAHVFGGTEDAKDAAGLLGVIGGSAAVTAIAGAVSTFVSQRRKILLRVAAFLAGPLVVLTAIMIVVNRGATAPFESWFVLAWLGAGAFIFGVWYRLDLTQWSLHPFYRRRLSSAFYTSRENATAVPVTDDLLLTDLARTEGRDGHAFPQLLVCAAANVTKSGATPPGRAAMPFVFSASSVGVPGYEATLEGQWKSLTVPQAVAMSGAAVSPLMGKKTVRAVRFLMALMNVRLGVWLPNPRLGDEAPSGRARPHLLIKEMLGLARPTDGYLYVTDGGHFENLGLVELLRRGCTTVFCLDGGGDPPGAFRALGEAVALSRSELQVDVDINPTPIVPDKDSGLATRGYALGTLRFRASPDGAQLADDPTGRIIYCRAAVSEDAPWDVRDFARRDKRFPFHSTMDQLFSDEKFESYRALGAHTARAAIQAWRREALREKVVEVLQAQARAKAYLSYPALVERVRAELTAVELPTLWPLLDEIGAEETAGQRPQLILVVQDREPEDPDIQAGLAAVFRYWGKLPSPDELEHDTSAAAAPQAGREPSAETAGGA